MIIFLLVFAALLYWVEEYSMEHGLDRTSFRTETDQVLVEPGEIFLWTMTMTNEKRIMIPYLKVREQVPAGLYFAENGEPVEKNERSGLTSTLYLSGRQQVKFTREVALSTRGRHFFRGVSAEAGDFLGLKSITESYPELREVVVKPRPLGSVALRELLGGFLGERSVRKSLMEDPVITIGFRDYTGREPFRSISWTQSARHNRLLVKQYDCTADVSCTVLLNTDSVNDGNRSARLEICYSLVRSACEELEKKKIPYDFRTNGVIAGAIGSWNYVGEGLGTGHLETVLEGLGRMTAEAKSPAEEFLRNARRQVRAGQSLILVTPQRTDTIISLAGQLSLAAGRDALILCAEEFMMRETVFKKGETG